MQFKSSLLGAAMILAFSVGSAHAADQFTTLAGVPAQPLTVAESAAVVGTSFFVSVCATPSQASACSSVGGTPPEYDNSQ